MIYTKTRIEIMQPIHITVKYWQASLFFIFLCLMTVFFAIVIVGYDSNVKISKPEFVGFIMLPYLILTLIRTSEDIFGSLPRFSISADGIIDNRNGMGLIKWVDIQDITYVRTRYQDLLGFKLVNPQEYTQKLNLIAHVINIYNQTFHHNDVTVNIMSCNLPCEEIERIAKDYWKRNRFSNTFLNV